MPGHFHILPSKKFQKVVDNLKEVCYTIITESEERKMTERQQRLVNYGYAIVETKSFLIIGMYSKNAHNFIKRVFHYFPVRIERK